VAFLALLHHYGLTTADGTVITRYFHYNQIMEVENGTIKCYIDRSHETVVDVDHNMEMLGVNRVNLDPMSFPLRSNYHHERQSIVFTKKIDLDLEVQIDIIVEGIIEPQKRKEQTPHLLELLKENNIDDSSPIISVSYLLITKPYMYAKALEEITEIRKCLSI